MSEPAQDEMRRMVGWPYAKKFNLFEKATNHRHSDNNNNPAWKCGASLSIVCINTEKIYCASAGDGRVAMSIIRGAGKYKSAFTDLSRDHRAAAKVI